MNTIRSADLGMVVDSIPAIQVKHFVRGKLVSGAAVRHRSRDLGADFTTPAIDLDALIMPRSEAPPLIDVGGQRVVRLGSAARHVMGGPHDAMYPLQRFIHWMGDEDA